MEINISSNRSTRSKTRTKQTDILLTDIKSTSRCLDLSLPRDLCCDNCKYKLDTDSGMTKKGSHTLKRFRDTSERRRCIQPWATIHGEAGATSATARKFIQTRNYLNIQRDVQ